MSNAYKGVRGIKVKLAGHKKIGLEEDVHEYASKLEARCAQIFLTAGIKFRPHVKFDCINKNGGSFTYTVDFLFDEPKKFVGISGIVNGIEVKGPLSHHDMDRIDALKFKHGIRAYIVTKPLIDMWENEGLFTKNNGVKPESKKKGNK